MDFICAALDTTIEDNYVDITILETLEGSSDHEEESSSADMKEKSEEERGKGGVEKARHIEKIDQKWQSRSIIHKK